MRITARVPATSANLGPGFDCFGLALDLCNEVTVDTEAEPGVSWEGEGADELPTDGSDMVSLALREACEALGPPIRRMSLHGTNRIPLERGLGSSAAAAVAGAAIGSVMADMYDPDDPFIAYGVASRLDGHPDNAAAAAYGGLTIVFKGVPRRLEPHPDLGPVLFVPERLRMSTAEARDALTDVVSRADAVTQLAHAAALLVGLTLDPALLISVRDHLHEEARLALTPEARDLRDQIRNRYVPVFLSGAGPSLIAFESDDVTVPDPPDGWRMLRLGVRTRGVEVSVEP